VLVEQWGKGLYARPSGVDIAGQQVLTASYECTTTIGIERYRFIDEGYEITFIFSYPNAPLNVI
jgi:hypothetical protein